MNDTSNLTRPIVVKPKATIINNVKVEVKGDGSTKADTAKGVAAGIRNGISGSGAFGGWENMNFDNYNGGG